MVDKRINTFNIGSLKKQFSLVSKSLEKLESDFYLPIMGIPTVDPNDLPLIFPTPSGFSDHYANRVNYFFYPWLFEDVFPGLKRETLDQLCIIAQLYAEAVIQIDKVIDYQLWNTSEVMKTLVIVSSQHKFASGIQRLSWLFGSDSPFWATYNRLLNDYVCQIFEEKTCKSLDVPSQSDMERHARNKVALTKILTAAMAELTGKKDVLPALEASQDLFSIGYQLYDDVKDWRIDYQNRQYSYFLKVAFESFDYQGRIADNDFPDINYLNRQLYISNFILSMLQLAADYMERAKEAVDGVNCPKWIQWIEVHQSHIQILKSDLSDLQDRAVERARLKSIPKVKIEIDQAGLPDRRSWSSAVQRGVAFLQEQESKDYLEARDLDLTGNIESGESALHRGTVFQRAITLHSLVLAKHHSYPIDETILNTDLQALIDSQPKNRIGGWNYFPAIPELPPDCDDLGEILLVLLKMAHPKISDYCDGIIKHALWGQKSDGSISTWIASPNDADSIRFREKIYSVWGSQPDTEVIANFLFALWKYNPDRFGKNIEKGAAYIAGKQDPEGFWSSTWYYGPYYGTMVCCRLLRLVGGYDANLQMARNFLLRSRNDNGNWDSSDDAVLNTAYALLALVAFLDERDPAIILPAARRLLELQRVNGSWKGSIFMKLRPMDKNLFDHPSFQEYYESDTMSTAFAVRALLYIEKLFL